VEDIRSVVNAVITRVERNPSLFEKQTASLDELRLTNALEQMILQFHAVTVQLRERYDDRATLDVSDEYDVQDLLHALLRLYFTDIRPEEWTPSYAGGAARTAFLLPDIATVIETKKTRPGLTAARLGEQLIVDIAKYGKHPQCKRLLCFIYDPEGKIANPSGIENDLNSTDHGIEVRTFILPKQ
jgi:REase_DpnII-MboI